MADHRGHRWGAIALNRALEGLPLVVMAGLTALTYWLVQTNVVPGTRTAAPIEHKPDYSLIDFTVRSFDAAGHPRTDIAGQRADHYPDTDTLEIAQPVLRSLAADAPPLVTTAERAVSNRDGSQVQLFGHARSVREATAQSPRLEFKGEFLHIWTREEKVRSNQPVEVVRGDATVRADSLDADNYDRVLQMAGHVRAVLPPGGAARRP